MIEFWSAFSFSSKIHTNRNDGLFCCICHFWIQNRLLHGKASPKVRDSAWVLVLLDSILGEVNDFQGQDDHALRSQRYLKFTTWKNKLIYSDIAKLLISDSMWSTIHFNFQFWIPFFIWLACLWSESIQYTMFYIKSTVHVIRIGKVCARCTFLVLVPLRVTLARCRSL